MKTVEIETYELPMYWASALINGDYSGMGDQDEIELNKWLNDVQPGSCVEVSEESYFGRFHNIGCDMSTYSFIKY